MVLALAYVLPGPRRPKGAMSRDRTPHREQHAVPRNPRPRQTERNADNEPALSIVIAPNGPIWYFTWGERWYPQSISSEIPCVYWREYGPWTQFWTFYARDRSPLPWRSGHRFDWELVQFTHDTCALSQHGHAQLISTHDMRWIDEQPCVYVALGKHSNWARPGLHHTHGIDFDIALGNGRILSHYRLEPAPKDGWADHTFGKITAPGRTLAWRNPAAWAARGA
jgi:hypothetical protein